MVIGLGNPGPEYAATRHNAGFQVVDLMVSRHPVLGSRVSADYEARRVRIGGRVLALVKPLTYMNRSGAAAVAVAREFSVLPTELLVVYDCLDLPLGRLRLRLRGSSGGHRGLESIIQSLGTAEIPRLRIGIGRSDREGVIDRVLSPWDSAELPLVACVLDTAVSAVCTALHSGVTEAMNRFNGLDLAVEADSVTRKPQGESDVEDVRGCIHP
jgi:PTH1 family peptidyl-tRNA hydrolase